jgi:hypothetical protein
VRKSQRRQNRPVHGKAHQYRATKDPENNHDDEATVTRLEKALEIGLEDTFPASDPIAVLQPGLSAAAANPKKGIPVGARRKRWFRAFGRCGIMSPWSARGKVRSRPMQNGNQVVE